MTTSFKTIIAGALIAATALAVLTAPVAAGPTLPGVTLNRQIGITPQIAPHLREQLRLTCVDLSVFVQQTRLSGDRIRITFGVRNISSVNYVTGNNQQAIVLSLHGREVRVGNFGDLLAGHTESWAVIVGKPFEFPDTYKANFSHDPDLYIDGNTMNDDCNQTNNARELVVSS